MITRTTIIAVTTIALCAGCSRGAATNNAAAPAKATASASSEPVPSATAAGSIDAALLTSRPWATDEACRDIVRFNPDGTMTLDDQKAWRWSLTGDVLTLTGEGGPDEPNTVSRNGPHFDMTSPGGARMTMYACPTG